MSNYLLGSMSLAKSRNEVRAVAVIAPIRSVRIGWSFPVASQGFHPPTHIRMGVRRKQAKHRTSAAKEVAILVNLDLHVLSRCPERVEVALILS
jgi:hypothetical protein